MSGLLALKKICRVFDTQNFNKYRFSFYTQSHIILLKYGNFLAGRWSLLPYSYKKT